MNRIELNNEFKKFKEISNCIIENEYLLNNYSTQDILNVISVEKLKFICLKQDLCEVDILENLQNTEKKERLKFCSEIKKNVNREFLETISMDINKQKITKNFNKFYDIYKQIIITEYYLKAKGNFSSYSKRDMNTLKFVCLRLKFVCSAQNLCEFDILENLSNLNFEEVLKFCSELKENVNREFLEELLK